MNQKTFRITAGTVFSLVAVLHAVRLLCGWDAVIGGWTVPPWASWAAFAVSGFLAFTAFRVGR